MTDEGGARLGSRLRRVRRQQGLSLEDVRSRSAGRFKPSVLGAYERGERTISIPRLRELAELYRVPVAELLSEPTRRARPDDEAPGLVIDLVALSRQRGDQPALAGYTERLRRLRGDHAGRVLTVRLEDLRTLAAADGRTPEALRRDLLDAGLLWSDGEAERAGAAR